MRGPVPEAAMHAHAMTPPHHLHHALQMRLYAWDHLQLTFFSNFHSFYDLSVVYC